MTNTLQAPTDVAYGTDSLSRPSADADPGSRLLSPEDGLSGADQRRLRHSTALRLAESLNAAENLPERVALYRSASRRDLNIAAGLWPELMPILNGELEWIALTAE